MKGLLEGVGVIALFILTPVIVVWVLIAGRLSLRRETLLDAQLFPYPKQGSGT